MKLLYGLQLLYGLPGLGLYAYTIYLAYVLEGIVAAILSACFPVVSNVYWIYRGYDGTGYFWNDYTIANAAVLILFLGTSLILSLVKK
jgi:hypothetical protein